MFLVVPGGLWLFFPGIVGDMNVFVFVCVQNVFGFSRCGWLHLRGGGGAYRCF